MSASRPLVSIDIERPFAAIGHHLKMLQRGPSLRPFVYCAAFGGPNVGQRVWFQRVAATL